MPTFCLNVLNQGCRISLAQPFPFLNWGATVYCVYCRMNVAAGSRKKKKTLYLIFYKVTCLDSTTRQIVTGMLLLCIKTKENLEIKAILTNKLLWYNIKCVWNDWRMYWHAGPKRVYRHCRFLYCPLWKAVKLRCGLTHSMSRGSWAIACSR